MRCVNGSMTVEASLVMPMMIFILAGLIQSLFFLHDVVILQCYADKQSEAILWQRDTMEAIPVYMMDIQNAEIKQSRLTEVADWIGNQTSVNWGCEGEMKINLPGIREWTGELLKKEVMSHAIRVNYTRDRVAAVLKKKETK